MVVMVLHQYRKVRYSAYLYIVFHRWRLGERPLFLIGFPRPLEHVLPPHGVNSPVALYNTNLSNHTAVTVQIKNGRYYRYTGFRDPGIGIPSRNDQRIQVRRNKMTCIQKLFEILYHDFITELSKLYRHRFINNIRSTALCIRKTS